MKTTLNTSLQENGEIVAEEHLRAKGYAIIERDWHSGHKDIDIIAKQGAEYVFIEVKTRTSNDFMAPEQAVNTQKLRNLRIAINHYIKSLMEQLPHQTA